MIRDGFQFVLTYCVGIAHVLHSNNWRWVAFSFLCVCFYYCYFTIVTNAYEKSAYIWT